MDRKPSSGPLGCKGKLMTKPEESKDARGARDARKTNDAANSLNSSRKRICVYCGSRSGTDSKYEKMAVALGTRMVTEQIDLVYGGGRVGLMGVVSRTVMNQGGQVFGVIPDGLFGKEVADTDITDLQVVASMHERKALMEKLSDFFLAIPGGWGTLDEFFEILTWAQIGIHSKPILLLNLDGFFDPLLAQIQLMVREGFVDSKYLSLLQVVTSIDEVFEQLPGKFGK
jgi:uncharacterized protein (TIGR00730 family)